MKFLRKCIGIGMSVLLGLTTLTTTALAGPPEQNVAKPGEAEYMHLNKYATKTDIPHVYHITLDVQPPDIKVLPPIFISVVLDASGSMLVDDIKTDSADITRYDALELAVSSFLKQLATSGNPNIFVNISSHGQIFGAPYTSTTSTSNNFAPYRVYPTGTAATHGFESIYNAGTTTLKSKFDKNDPSWIMDAGGSTDGRWYTWDYYDTNNIGFALKKSYNFMRDAMNDTPSAGMPQYMPASAVRYVLVMGDGDDTLSMDVGHPEYNSGAYTVPVYQQHLTEAQNYALALKAPLDPFYKKKSTTTSTIAGVADGGLGASVWGVIVGTSVSHRSTWRDDILKTNWDTLGPMYTTWSSSAGSTYGFGEAEPRLAFTTMALKKGSTLPTTPFATMKDAMDFYRTMYSGSATTNGPSVKNVDDVSAGQTSDTNYFRSSSTNGSDSVTDVFKSFAYSAATAAGGGLDTTITDFIGEKFSLYKMAGKPMLELITSDSDSDFKQEVSNKGKEITWTLNKLNGGEKYQLSYYVYFNSEDTSTDIWYESNAEAYIDYTNLNGEEVIKYFPKPLVQGEDNITPKPTEAPGMYSSTDDSLSDGGSLLPGAGGTLPGYVIPGELKPYTPSVTIRPISVFESTKEEEIFADETAEVNDYPDDVVTNTTDIETSKAADSNETEVETQDIPPESTKKMPKTGESSSMAIAIVLLIVSTSIIFALRKRSSQK